MQTGFHHEDVPPQLWLDELHEFNIPHVWDVQLNKTQRENLSKRALDQLKNWRTSLRDQMKKIEGRYDSSNQERMAQIIAPYKLLDQLGHDLNANLRDLQSRVSSGRAVPQGFEIGERIFGDFKSKRWHLGSREDERLWEDFLATESRYWSMGKEYKRQATGLKNASQRVQEQQADLEKLVADYKKRSGFMQLGLRLFIVLLVVIFCLALGISAFTVGLPIEGRITNTMFAGIMLGLSVVGAIVAIVLARRRRASVAVLKQDIIAMRATLKELKQEARRQKQLFFPTQETFKQVQADYKVLKAAFE